MKKILKEGEGYERPDDGTVVQGNVYNNILWLKSEWFLLNLFF
jgi:hypothetical protein